MTTVNMHEAKTGLSKLVEAIENGTESEIVLARNGKPVARIVPLEEIPVVDVSKRLGIAEGQFGSFSLEEFNEMDEEIARKMIEGPLFPDEPVVEPTKPKKSA